ncbi:MAG TPA: hypothetical protein VFN77_02155 [Acetobacteraceae bacterium]|nr:hypothetical protein [Acetobacteraceae bacterium]
MPETEITKLRRARIRCHKSLKQAEVQVERFQTKLAEIEAAIYAIAPEIDLPLRFRKSNPIFARGEMSRYVLDVLREAERPLTMREIAARMLERKGVVVLDPGLREYICNRLSCQISVLHKRGLIEMVSVRERWRWTIFGNA